MTKPKHGEVQPGVPSKPAWIGWCARCGCAEHRGEAPKRGWLKCPDCGERMEHVEALPATPVSRIQGSEG